MDTRGAISGALWITGAVLLGLGAGRAAGAGGTALTAETLGRLSPEARGLWSVREQAAPAARLPLYGRLRPILQAETLRTAALALRARWLDPELEDRLTFVPVGDHLEAVDQSAVWGDYECEGARVLLLGHWRFVSAVVRPTQPPPAFAALGAASAPRADAAVGPWPDPPANVRDALAELWRLYVADRTTEAPPEVVTYFGFPAMRARLIDLGFEKWWAECLVFCDGSSAGVLVTKPRLFCVDSSGLARECEPAPRQPAARPLNPARVAYEDTCLYRDGGGWWVDQPERATRGLIRLIALSGPGLPIGNSRLYCVKAGATPVSDAAWQTCEFEFLCRGALSAAQRSVSDFHGVVYHRRDLGPVTKRFLADTALAELAATLASWQQVAAPPGCGPACHSATAALEEAAALCRSRPAVAEGKPVVGTEDEPPADDCAPFHAAIARLKAAQQEAVVAVAGQGVRLVDGIHSDW